MQRTAIYYIKSSQIARIKRITQSNNTIHTYLSIDCALGDDIPPIGATVATLQTAATVGMNKADLVDALASNAGGHSVGANMMDGDKVRSVGHVFEKQMNEEMNQIKHMIYGTWVLIIACFVINMGVVNGVCSKNKVMTFKSVHESDDEEAECL
eukprot:270435_1